MKAYSIRLMVPEIGKEELAAVEEVLDSGQLVEGARAHEFEELISQKAGAKYTVLCTSGTTGLELALKALNLQPGDEVVLPAFTHPATVLCVMNVGLTPVLVDVDRKTFNTNADLLAQGLSSKTKVLMPVSWGGYPLDMVPIMALARKHGLSVVEDAACALGTSYDGGSTGSLADLTVFSFHPRKLVALGDGGAVSTNNEELYKILKRLKHFGSVAVGNKISFATPGGNYRLSNVLAAMGIPQIKRLDRTIAGRTEKAEYYDRLFAHLDWVQVPYVTPRMKPSYQSYCIALQVPKLRDLIISTLRPMGIEVQFGTYSIDQEPVCADVKKVSDLAASHFLGEHLLTLPLHHKLTTSDQECVFREIQNCKNHCCPN